MENTKHQSRMSKVVAGARSASPVVEIRSYALAGSGMARVVIDVTHTQESRNDPQMVAQTLNKKLLSKMAVVASTFHTLEKSAFTERLTGVVSVVRQAMSAEGDMKGFRAMASNMFMDDEKDMWVLRKTQAGQILVKTTGIDDDITLANMLDSVSSATASSNNAEHARMTAQASVLANEVEAGDYVSYVTADNLLAQGYVVAGVVDSDDLVVLSSNSDVEEVIKRVAVTEVHDQTDFPAVEETKEEAVETIVAASKGSIDLSYLLAYYKKVFARSPKYYAEFAQRLQQHAFF
jgi:hypothetical protein